MYKSHLFGQILGVYKFMVWDHESGLSVVFSKDQFLFNWSNKISIGMVSLFHGNVTCNNYNLQAVNLTQVFLPPEQIARVVTGQVCHSITLPLNSGMEKLLMGLSNPCSAVLSSMVLYLNKRDIHAQPS